jgi:hypothetical protein
MRPHWSGRHPGFRSNVFLPLLFCELGDLVYEITYDLVHSVRQNDFDQETIIDRIITSQVLGSTPISCRNSKCFCTTVPAPSTNVDAPASVGVGRTTLHDTSPRDYSPTSDRGHMRGEPDSLPGSRFLPHKSHVHTPNASTPLWPVMPRHRTERQRGGTASDPSRRGALVSVQ